MKLRWPYAALLVLAIIYTGYRLFFFGTDRLTTMLILICALGVGLPVAWRLISQMKGHS